MRLSKLPLPSPATGYQDDLFFELTTAYRRFAENLQEPIHSALYSFQTPWYLTELEELLRYGLMCFDRFLIEAPHPISGTHSMRDPVAIENYYTELGSSVSCNFTCFDHQALTGIHDLVGDALDYGELVLLPSFSVSVDLDDEFADDSATQYEAGEYWRMFAPMWKKTAACRAIRIIESQETLRIHDVGLPVFLGGRIQDLIKLRRDEQDAFLHWLRHFDQLNSHSHLSAVEVQQALVEGLAEIDSRVKLLRRKGILDLISTSAVGTGLSLAIDAGEMGILSASIGAAGGIAQATKALLEQQHERALLQRLPMNFLWQASRLPP